MKHTASTNNTASTVSLFVHRIHTQHSQQEKTHYTSRSQLVHKTFTIGSQIIHNWFAKHSQLVHKSSTIGSQNIHNWFTNHACNNNFKNTPHTQRTSFSTCSRSSPNLMLTGTIISLVSLSFSTTHTFFFASDVDRLCFLCAPWSDWLPSIERTFILFLAQFLVSTITTIDKPFSMLGASKNKTLTK